MRYRGRKLWTAREKRFQESPLVLGLSPAEARQPTAAKNTRTKGSFIGGGKRGRRNGRDERRGNTVQRHLRAVWVKHWPHLNIHSQCVTFSPTLPRWHTQQPEPIWSHRGSLLAFMFKIHTRLLPPTWPPFPNKTNTAATYGCSLMVHFHLWKPTVELSLPPLTARSHDEFSLMPYIFH